MTQGKRLGLIKNIGFLLKWIFSHIHNMLCWLQLYVFVGTIARYGGLKAKALTPVTDVLVVGWCLLFRSFLCCCWSEGHVGVDQGREDKNKNINNHRLPGVRVCTHTYTWRCTWHTVHNYMYTHQDARCESLKILIFFGVFNFIKLIKYIGCMYSWILYGAWNQCWFIK